MADNLKELNKPFDIDVYILNELIKYAQMDKILSNNKELTKANTVFVKDEDGHNYAIHEDDITLFFDLLLEGYKRDDFSGFESCDFYSIGGDTISWREKNLK